MTKNSKQILRLLNEIDQRIDKARRVLAGPGKSVKRSNIKTATKKKVQSSATPSCLIDRLISEGYFKEKRRDVDCQDQLKILGFTVPRKQIATVLLRKLRSRKLKRNETKEGYVYFTR